MQTNKIPIIGITVNKENDWSEWFTQVLTKAEMISYGDISGCYILRPTSYFIWEQIQKYLDKRFKKLGVKNCYFPLFGTKQALEAEKDFIENFSPEVAWVTKSGQSELSEPIFVRPTSETIMYPVYSNWIKSHRDLPLKLNQWNNVVRWEFKKCTPFLRSREFLWNEGHTAFATQQEADNEVLDILKLYESVYSDLLAIPVVAGRKSIREKFGGAEYTTTVECFIDCNGRAIQGATFHSLGQNFSNLFDISFSDENSHKSYVYQNSWGITTRTIGVMTMIHGDNKGLVLPPRVAPIQVVIIPVYNKKFDDNTLNDYVDKVANILSKSKIRVKIDCCKTHSVGHKYNTYELHGIPLRIEIGPKEVSENKLTLVSRHDGKKTKINMDEMIVYVNQSLFKIQEDLLNTAKTKLYDNIQVVTDWNDFVLTANKKKLIIASWCEDPLCEDWIKQTSAEEAQKYKIDDDQLSAGIKSLCIPFDQQKYSILKNECINPCCKNNVKSWTLFGRSY